MTVKELITILQRFPEDNVVCIYDQTTEVGTLVREVRRYDTQPYDKADPVFVAPPRLSSQTGLLYQPDGTVWVVGWA